MLSHLMEPVGDSAINSCCSLVPLLLSSARAVLLPPMASWPSAEADVLSRLLQRLHGRLVDSCRWSLLQLSTLLCCPRLKLCCCLLPACCCRHRPAHLLHGGLSDNAGVPLTAALYLRPLSKAQAVLLPIGGVLVQ